MVLSAQIAWSENVENALSNVGGGGDVGPLQSVLSNVEVTLNVLADSVLMEQPPLRRRKLEHLVSLIPEPCLPSALAVKGKDALKCAFCIKRKISLELGSIPVTLALGSGGRGRGSGVLGQHMRLGGVWFCSSLKIILVKARLIKSAARARGPEL